MATDSDLGAVPGLPESALAAADLAALPGQVAPAPWTCRVRALLWVQRAHPPVFGWLGPPRPIAVACVVQYLDTPVGPYHEVLVASPLRNGLLPTAQIPFIAVDSLASVRGGRANWGLPKTMARFDLDLARAHVDAVEATAGRWSISVRPRQPDRRARVRPRFPVWSRFRAIGPLGVYRTTARGTGRLVRVTTQAHGPTLTGWLGGGTHLALEWSGTMRITAPVAGGGPRRKLRP